MNTIYTADQYDTCYPPGIEKHWWTIARSAQVSRIVRAENKTGDVFLEVGCGKGLEVKALRTAGIDVYGVELADVQPLEGMESFVSSGMDAVQLPIAQREQVTGLLLLDVIEHLPDPITFLKKLESRFPKLSVVVIAVPGLSGTMVELRCVLWPLSPLLDADVKRTGAYPGLGTQKIRIFFPSLVHSDQGALMVGR